MSRLQSVISPSPSLAIADCGYPKVVRYFESLNAGDMATAASLFMADGELHPPFESAIVGREAIQSYLSAEAKAMTLTPHHVTLIASDQNWIQLKVTGTVQTPLFGVNVAWLFVLTTDGDIACTQVKLLASLQELLRLNQG